MRNRLLFCGEIICRKDDIKNASVLAFVFISSIDYNNKIVNLNTTFDGDLPNTVFIKGSVVWNK